MTVKEVREKYLQFLRERDHVVIPSASITPENDPTTLFTSSGMQPLVPYLLGKEHPQGDRLTDSQKCFRADDIEEVGDNRHTTFFEMLGNWSLGSYFKKEQLPWFFAFLTDELGLDPNRIYVTVYEGGDGIDKDEESVAIWKELFASKGIEAKDIHIGSEEDGYKKGMQGGRIFYYDAKKNWWSRSGAPNNMPVGEPGGPDSEVFYDFGEEFADPAYKDMEEHPNSDSGRFIEIGNSVFMEFIKEEGGFGKLPRKNVDFGGGLERITAATLGDPDVFKIDVFTPTREKIAELSGTSYEGNEVSYRVIMDHLRGATFMIGDGVMPSNTEAGYILRRLIRRAVRHADKLSITEGSLHELAKPYIDVYKDHYTNLGDKEDVILNAIKEEEEKFRKTLKGGMKQFSKIEGDISGEDAFVLFTSYGFPLELTLELAQEEGKNVDVEGYKKAFEEHQAKSREGAEKKFKGGLADNSEMSVKYHTATHLLHRALKDVLGEDVMQKGSNITPERLRFDFSFDRKMTDEEKAEVEKIVNEQIAKNLPVTHEDISLEDAKKRGAIGLFEEKYGDVVRVYSVGDYSLEFCGGPHVENTSELGHFRIKKEEASSAGIRRIKAVLE
ncbi:MAG: alanine--tRNA ligase-related protein [Patescibacteria group bacterium UBA2103]